MTHLNVTKLSGTAKSVLVCLLFASLVPRTAQIASGSGIIPFPSNVARLYFFVTLCLSFFPPAFLTTLPFFFPLFPSFPIPFPNFFTFPPFSSLSSLPFPSLSSLLSPPPPLFLLFPISYSIHPPCPLFPHLSLLPCCPLSHTYPFSLTTILLFIHLCVFIFSPLCHACTCSMCMLVCCNSVLCHVSMGTPYKHVLVFIFCLSCVSLVLSGLNQSTSTWCPMVTAHIGAG